MRLRAATFAVLLPALGAHADDDQFGFMPDGGREMFSCVFMETDERKQALTQQRTAEEWQAEILERMPKLSKARLDTLAAYLSVIAPLPGDWTDGESALPPDGRDLALAQCQSCHSLFTGYLMQRRDRAGWQAVFVPPFHKKIPMTDSEKQVFSDYSAINMPLRIEDVPPELRF